MKVDNNHVPRDDRDQNYLYSLTSDLSSRDAIVEGFHRDGFCILTKALDPLALQGEWYWFAQDYFTKCFEILYKNGHTKAPTHYDAGKYVLGLGAKHGFREVVMRSPGRYELSLLHTPPDQLPSCWKSMLEQPLWTTLVPALLGRSSLDDLKLCHLSLLVATPGSTEQGWHADGGHVDVTKHMPCHVLNLFLPLADVPLEKGPTELRPGTHHHTRNLAPMMLAAKCKKTLRQPFVATLDVGDILMFDYRVLHRGKANTSTQNRAILVLTYSQPWFQDVLNFPNRSMMEPAETSDAEQDNKQVGKPVDSKEEQVILK